MAASSKQSLLMNESSKESAPTLLDIMLNEQTSRLAEENDRLKQELDEHKKEKKELKEENGMLNNEVCGLHTKINELHEQLNVKVMQSKVGIENKKGWKALISYSYQSQLVTRYP